MSLIACCNHPLGSSEGLSARCARPVGHDGEHRSAFELVEKIATRTIECTTCRGGGTIESSDSTDDRIYKCWTCDGTGKIADRRRPDPQLTAAVSLVRELAELLDAGEFDAGEDEAAVDEALRRADRFLGSQAASLAPAATLYFANRETKGPS